MTTSRLFPALFCIIFGFLLGGCGGCDDSGDLSENLTIYSEGSGAPNAEPLFPMQPGSVWEDAIFLDSFTYREEVFYRIVARQTLLTGTEQWFSRDDTGVWLRGSSADGILEIPLLIVPNEVRLGMAWEMDLNGTLYQFEVLSVEPGDAFSSANVWTIGRFKNNDKIDERAYLEGFGPAGNTIITRLDADGSEPVERPETTPIEITNDDVPYPIRSIAWAENANSATGRATAYGFKFRPQNNDAIYTDLTVNAFASPSGSLTLEQTGQYYEKTGVSRFFASASTIYETAYDLGEIYTWDTQDQPISAPPNGITVVSDDEGSLRIGGGYAQQTYQIMRQAPESGQSPAFVRQDQGGTIYHQAAPDIDEHLVLPPRTFGGWMPQNGNVCGSSLHHPDGRHEQLYFVVRGGGTVDEMTVHDDGVSWRRLGRLDLPEGYDLRAIIKRLDGTYEGFIWRDDEDAARQHSAPTRQNYGDGKLFRAQFDDPQPLELPDSVATMSFTGDLLVCWTGDGEGVQGTWKLGGFDATVRAIGDSCVFLIRDWAKTPVVDNQYELADFWHFEGEISHMGRVRGRSNPSQFKNFPNRPHAPRTRLGDGQLQTPRKNTFRRADDWSAYWWLPFEIFGGAVDDSSRERPEFDDAIHSQWSNSFFFTLTEDSDDVVYERRATGPPEALHTFSEPINTVFPAVDGGVAVRNESGIWTWVKSGEEAVSFDPGGDSVGRARFPRAATSEYFCYDKTIEDPDQPDEVIQGTQCIDASGESRFLPYYLGGVPLDDGQYFLFDRLDSQAGTYILTIVNVLTGEIMPYPVQVPHPQNSAPNPSTIVGYLDDGRPILWMTGSHHEDGATQTELIAFGVDGPERVVYMPADREPIGPPVLDRVATETWVSRRVNDGIVMTIYGDIRSDLQPNRLRPYEVYRAPIIETTPLTTEEPWPRVRLENL